jgi:Receptor family ligand binding region
MSKRKIKKILLLFLSADIPHIQTHLEVEERLESSINIYPSQKILNDAIFDVMKFLNWTKCAIIYDPNDGNFVADINGIVSGHKVRIYT